MRWSNVALKQVPERVQGSVQHGISGMEGLKESLAPAPGKRQPEQLSPDPEDQILPYFGPSTEKMQL